MRTPYAIDMPHLCPIQSERNAPRVDLIDTSNLYSRQHLSVSSVTYYVAVARHTKNLRSIDSYQMIHHWAFPLRVGMSIASACYVCSHSFKRLDRGCCGCHLCAGIVHQLTTFVVIFEAI